MNYLLIRKLKNALKNNLKSLDGLFKSTKPRQKAKIMKQIWTMLPLKKMLISQKKS